MRRGTSLEGMRELKMVFDKDGTVTAESAAGLNEAAGAGNSSKPALETDRDSVRGRQLRACQPIEAHAFFGRLQCQRTVNLRWNAHFELSAVGFFGQRRGNVFAVTFHVGHRSGHDLANSG